MPLTPNREGKLYQVELPPEILARGFWLYLWKIAGPADERLCYVGMTGDVTGVAQSPFARAGGHFSSTRRRTHSGDACRRVRLSQRTAAP
jgi:hypothetical protein